MLYFSMGSFVLSHSNFERSLGEIKDGDINEFTIKPIEENK